MSAVDREQCFSGDRSPARRTGELLHERRLEGPNWRLCLFCIQSDAKTSVNISIPSYRLTMKTDVDRLIMVLNICKKKSTLL